MSEVEQLAEKWETTVLQGEVADGIPASHHPLVGADLNPPDGVGLLVQPAPAETEESGALNDVDTSCVSSSASYDSSKAHLAEPYPKV